MSSDWTNIIGRMSVIITQNKCDNPKFIVVEIAREKFQNDHKAASMCHGDDSILFFRHLKI